ncbi:hypothetical protein [Marinobacter sp. F4218]|uniref:hypothetical protein n=1 Tax=Marinobacter sp. F4218 TaxID=2862868 RepID=UPI001C62616E|nr:hypothetical protein [Marinobacter sp. F4218]MBW7469830.1 hypothetical protein [Marinobacter sp. F4218]
MYPHPQYRKDLPSLLTTALVAVCWASPSLGDAPCNELDECRVLIEINATDGDIGFHVLFDAEGWRQAKIIGPDGKLLFLEQARKALKDQKLTENFFESAEPVCEPGLVEEPGDEVVTLPEFLARFEAGFYEFQLKLDNGGVLAGTTLLSHFIPAAPADVDFDGTTITWSYGDDLGECTTQPDGFVLAGEGDIVAYEVVMEPDDDALAPFTYSVRIPAGVNSVSVPSSYLAALPANAPLKVEVGAIERRPNGSFGNQTFSEEDGFCNNPDQEQCPGEEED